MKISCLPVSLYPRLSSGAWQLTDWFEFAHELGLDGADVSVLHLPDRAPAALHGVARRAAATGVAIPMLVAYSDFTQPDPAARAREGEKLRSDIDSAAELGAAYLRVTAGQAYPDLERRRAIGWVVDGLTAAAAYAASSGVTLAYENHTIGYGWRFVDFSQPAEIFLEIVAETAGSDLGILFDTANCYAAGDDGLAVLRQVAARMVYLHASDIRRAGHYEPVTLGSGVVPLDTLFDAARQGGYAGWVSLEEASKQEEAGFAPAVAALRRLWG